MSCLGFALWLPPSPYQPCEGPLTLELSGDSVDQHQNPNTTNHKNCHSPAKTEITKWVITYCLKLTNLGWVGAPSAVGEVYTTWRWRSSNSTRCSTSHSNGSSTNRVELRVALACEYRQNFLSASCATEMSTNPL